MDENRLSAIKARVSAAAQGPWTTALENGVPFVRDANGRDVAFMFYEEGANEFADADMHFIAHAREDVEDLAAEVERLTAELAAIRVSYEERGTALMNAVKRASDAQRLLDATEGTEREEELARQIRAEAQAQVAAARREGAEAVRDAAMSVADDLAGGTPEASDAEWAHELMHRVAAAVARVGAAP